MESCVMQLAHRTGIIKSHGKVILVYALIALGIAGCRGQLNSASSAVSTPPEQIAQDVLIEYFSLLHSGNYQEASELFGGSYYTLIEQNPTIDPSNHAALFKNACEINGAQCLKISGAPILDRISDRDFVFLVEFEREDGSIFSRGPCCGGPQPPARSFSFVVMQISEGEFLVIDTPIFVP